MMNFDAFAFDSRTLELRRDGVPVPLQQQPARVLGVLLARRGELVTREELRKEIWGDETFVDFNQSLNFCVRQIRAALGDDADEPRYIETLRGRGYRFKNSGVARAALPPVTAAPAPVASPARGARAWTFIAAAAAVIVVPVVWGVANTRERAAAPVVVAPFPASDGSEAWSTTLRAQVVAHLTHANVSVVEAGDAGDASPARAGWRLDARVDRSVEQYRVTATLRDPEGVVRFSDVFDGPPGDWIDAQNEMARIISQAVRYHVEGPGTIDGIERRAPRRKIPFS